MLIKELKRDLKEVYRKYVEDEAKPLEPMEMWEKRIQLVEQHMFLYNPYQILITLTLWKIVFSYLQKHPISL